MDSVRKIIVYIAMSLDGYISKPEDDLSFLKVVEKQGEDYGYNDFVGGVDTVLVGRRTYDWVIGEVGHFPDQGKRTFVITSTPGEKKENIEFYSGSIQQLVLDLKKEAGKNVFVEGGAELITALLKQNLVDEWIISIIPVLVGDGIRLFKDGRPEQYLEFVSVKTFETGLVQLKYQRIGAD